MNKKVNFLIILSFLFILILAVSHAYSKYQTDVTGEAQADVANWNISVNDCNIVNPDKTNTACFEETTDDATDTKTVVKNFTVSDIQYNNNDNNNVIDTKIAPGSSGMFLIKIKPNDTEVSIKYTLTASVEADTDSIKLYRSDPNDTNKIELENDGYTGYIYYSADNTDYEEVIRIYVDWEQDDEEENNIKDTKIGTDGNAPKLKIPVKIVFEQYKG